MAKIIERKIVFGEIKCLSPVRSFKWQNGLDFILAISSTEECKNVVAAFENNN